MVNITERAHLFTAMEGNMKEIGNLVRNMVRASQHVLMGRKYLLVNGRMVNTTLVHTILVTVTNIMDFSKTVWPRDMGLALILTEGNILVYSSVEKNVLKEPVF